MLKEFLEKQKKGEYISTYLYESIKDELGTAFDIDSYNEQVLEKLYEKYQNYFASMFLEIDKNICLDKEQIKAILADEDYSLIIAGAGSGKTTTMVAKVKYLVDIKHVNPSSILVMSYTKKATEELEKRIVYDFGIPARVTTIHSLGYQYIRQIFYPRRCYIVDNNLKQTIFANYFKEKIFPYKWKIKQIVENFHPEERDSPFFFSKFFMKNYEKFATYQEFFDFYKKETIRETLDIEEKVTSIIDSYLNAEIPKTIQNELVKSIGEAKIANFLYCNGISYTYEKVYEELMDDYKIYRPDFTIESGGEKIYIEYFGLSNCKEEDMQKYNKIKELKIAYHQTHHTKFIALDYLPNENYMATLTQELQKHHVKFYPKTYEEIYERLLENNPLSQVYRYENFLYQRISDIKSSPARRFYRTKLENYIEQEPLEKQNELKIQLSYIDDFYHYYQSELYGHENYGFDFDDLIYYATLYLDRVKGQDVLNINHIIIDEYQDISFSRYEFTRRVANQNHAKVTAVGDDWQTIFSFAGSRIDYIYHFQKYFPGAKLLHITKTYRNSQELISYSGAFIMKNESQIKKELVSDKNLKYPIRFIEFEQEEEYETLKRLILWIHYQNKEDKILILGRTNQIINRCFLEPELKDSVGTKIEFRGLKDLEMNGMTIHKSKGLTYDQVILIGLSNNWPRENANSYWFTNVLKEKNETEKILYPEERRLFYVALTRTKNYVYLLVNKDQTKNSPFISEIKSIMKEQEKNKASTQPKIVN